MGDRAFWPLPRSVALLPASGECSEIACYRRARRHSGLCKRHYKQHMRGLANERPCTVSGCTSKKIRAYGRCNRHYLEMRRESTCEVKCCPGVVYREDLCRKHFSERFARCRHGTCESTEMYCLDRMLCRRHYNVEYRTKGGFETGPEADAPSFGGGAGGERRGTRKGGASPRRFCLLRDEREVRLNRNRKRSRDVLRSARGMDVDLLCEAARNPTTDSIRSLDDLYRVCVEGPRAFKKARLRTEMLTGNSRTGVRKGEKQKQN